VTVRHLSRRQLLLGASGFTLGLPFLPSLLPRAVQAQSLPLERRFVAFATDHGGLVESFMFPDENLLTDARDLYAGHTIRRGDLLRTESGDRASVSGVLAGRADRLTSDLVLRMNVLRGLDIPFYIAHHTGGHLGNYARNDGNGEDGQAMQGQPMPTIDQIMAYSSGFYESLAGITERSLILGSGRLSFGYSSPSSQSGAIEELKGESNPLTAFRKVFVPEEDPNEPAPRPPVVDRVLESYRTLRESNRRLGAEDRRRLDDHMDRLAELERRLGGGTVQRASCGSVNEPEAASPNDPIAYHAAMNDVIVAAFLCGTSRIAVVKINESSFVEYSGDWHQEVAHRYFDPDPQALLQQANQKAFEFAVLDLASKLNVEEAPGRNVLDSALIQWTQESGQDTHESRSAPVVTFGSAGARLSTGQYCDYRKRTSEGIVNRWSSDIGYSGLLHSQWLAMALGVMGVPLGEFQGIEHNGEAGYGLPFREEPYLRTHSEGVFENASDPLPFLAKEG
jgi:Protein of unknown function (DUF1552)